MRGARGHVWEWTGVASALFDAITRLPEYYLTRRERDIPAARAADVAALTRSSSSDRVRQRRRGCSSMRWRRRGGHAASARARSEGQPARTARLARAWACQCFLWRVCRTASLRGRATLQEGARVAAGVAWSSAGARRGARVLAGRPAAPRLGVMAKPRTPQPDEPQPDGPQAAGVGEETEPGE